MHVLVPKHFIVIIDFLERVSLLEYGEQQIANATELIEKSWEALKNLHYDMPCGPSDSEVSNYYCRYIVECRRGRPRRWVPQVRHFLKVNSDNLFDVSFNKYHNLCAGICFGTLCNRCLGEMSIYICF